jgi:hypothetical protein
MDFVPNILVGAIDLSVIDLNKFVLVTYRICMLAFLSCFKTFGLYFSG